MKAEHKEYTCMKFNGGMIGKHFSNAIVYKRTNGKICEIRFSKYITIIQSNLRFIQLVTYI